MLSATRLSVPATASSAPARASRELPGYLTVGGAGARLQLAPRSVRDLIYTGRLPSVRLGRRHYLRTLDVEAERRRRLGLPLPERRRAPLARRSARRPRGVVPQLVLGREAAGQEAGRPLAALGRAGRQGGVRRPVDTSTRRRRAAERARMLERWLRAGRRPIEPQLPFAVRSTAATSPCAACGRVVAAGGRVVETGAADGRPAAQLCLTCGRRTLLAWSDERRRESTAARLLARQLGSAAAATATPSATAA